LKSRWRAEIAKRLKIGRASVFEAVAATLPLGSVAYEPELNARGERLTATAVARMIRSKLKEVRQ